MVGINTDVTRPGSFHFKFNINSDITAPAVRGSRRLDPVTLSMKYGVTINITNRHNDLVGVKKPRSASAERPVQILANDRCESALIGEDRRLAAHVTN